jgi:tetratricopeptide (TPR) repeat protein
MFCSACGKKCPEDASFCAYCGAKLPQLPHLEAAPGPAEVGMSAFTAPQGGEGDPAHRPFQRPAAEPVDAARLVRPLVDNPAQPLRGAAEQEKVQPDARKAGEEAPALQGEGPKGGQRRLSSGGPDGGRRMRKQPADEASKGPGKTFFDDDDEWVRPPREARGRASLEQSEAERAAAREARKGAVRKQPADGRAEPRPRRPSQGKAVTASGGIVTPPARKAPVTKSSGPYGLRLAKRPRGESADLFFEDLEMPQENFYDEMAEQDALSRKIKSIVAVAFLICVAIVVFWFFVMPGGQMFRANLGMGAPATAYKAIGDQARANGQINRAADAYHDALKLDPENYEYALLVGQTQEMIGAREKAAIAYKLCVTLRPDQPEPYRLLSDLYDMMGDAQSASVWLAEGYKQTGDESLAPKS